MKVIIVALALVAIAAAASVPSDPRVVGIVRSNVQQQPDGSYNFEFESEDGVVRAETGEVKQVLDEDKKPHDVVVVRGQYSYPSENGPEHVEYYADETGYHATGDSIPKGPARR